jgi:hypothetical protein
MWAYIREKDLQDPKDRRKIVCDELLHSLFRVKTINMFQMNKALTKHIWPLGDGDGNSSLSLYNSENFHMRLHDICIYIPSLPVQSVIDPK